MAAEYRTYLAANVLNEDRVITYRLLSRALQVHVNIAKEMLFEFHRQQNGKKPGSVYATYLVAGHRLVDTAGGRGVEDGEDAHLQSSPFQSSPLGNGQDIVEEGPVLSITLVREDDLHQLRSLYKRITSIHIYSLGPQPLKDLQALSDASREVYDDYTTQDPLGTAAAHGTIGNKGVRRRTGRRLPPPPSATASALPNKTALNSKQEAVAEELKTSTSSSTTGTKTDAKPAQSSAAKDFFSKGTAKKDAAGNINVAKTPSIKREPSDIFKSFAKAKPKLRREGTDNSAVHSGTESLAQSAADDSPMKDASDDEEETYVPPPVSKEIVDKDRNARMEREAALKAMMEDDDDDCEESVASPAVEEAPEPILERAEPAEQGVEVGGGRRRGRRRIMKKKTIKDEEGYLVTQEEPAWESFSEDEPVAKKPKPAPLSTSSGSVKGKKPAGKVGQGSIMSFFGKK